MKRGFTLIEMLVVVAIIIILLSIALAVGIQVTSASKRQLTVSELNALAGMEVTLNHKTGGVPSNMAQFLQSWQAIHSALVGPKHGPFHWQLEPSSLQNLPNIQSGLIEAPGNTAKEKGVTAVLDGWGHAIEFIPGRWVTQMFLGKLVSVYIPPRFISSGPDGIMGSRDDISVNVP